MEVRYQVFIKAWKPNCILVKVESNYNVKKCLSMIPIHQEMNANSTLKLQLPHLLSLSLRPNKNFPYRNTKQKTEWFLVFLNPIWWNLMRWWMDFTEVELGLGFPMKKTRNLVLRNVWIKFGIRQDNRFFWGQWERTETPCTTATRSKLQVLLCITLSIPELNVSPRTST